ncbi:MAG: Crp/Fnr family transcriptional regulator [Beijerinckiaceae bacterium]
MTGGEWDKWLDAYSPLAQIEPAERARLEALPAVQMPAGTVLFSPGSPCRGFVLVLDGRVRVSLTSENGRMLTLYRVGVGETCVQTTLCAAAGGEYSAEGVAETGITLVVVPLGLFDELTASSRAFRQFVFSRFGERMADMTRILETIAFVRVDARLAKALLSKPAGSPVAITHQALADEIGSAREVVTRQLQAFARQKLVGLRRGAIDVIDRHGLGLIGQIS